MTLTVQTISRRNWTQCNPALDNGKKILITTKCWLEAQNRKNKEHHRSVHEHQWFQSITMCPPLHQDQDTTTIPQAWTNTSSHSMGQLLPSSASSDHQHTDRAWHVTFCHMSPNCSHWTVNVIITMGPTAGLRFFSPKENKFFAVALKTLRETDCWSPEYKSLSLSQSWPLLCQNAQELALESVCAVNFNTEKSLRSLKTSLLSYSKEEDTEKKLVWVIGEMFSATDNAGKFILPPFTRPKNE